MTQLNVKGHSIKLKITKTGYSRKAVLFANNIVDELKKLDIIRDDIKIKTNTIGNTNFPATIEFWSRGYYSRFSYALTNRFIDNLYVIKELIRLEVLDVLEGRKDLHSFFQTFTSENRKELNKELKVAKNLLGLDEEENDITKINLAYKKLARKSHPDLGGDMDTFQEINKAHKLIKKEMGF